jgi:glutathione peroxidase
MQTFIKRVRMLKILLIMIVSTQLALSKGEPMSLYDFHVRTIEGDKYALSRYKGKVLLIVNVASRCGFTPQYSGLEKLYKRYKDEGFEILGFPCNQFRNQEPADEATIKSFCKLRYGVTFPMFAKIKVNGDDAHPLYKYLKKVQAGFLGTESIKWNFTKFLVDREGHVIKRFGSMTKPSEIEADIKRLL